MGSVDGLVTVQEAAKELAIDPSRVRELIHAGDLPAERLGGRWVMSIENLERVRNRRAGRPLAPRVAWGLAALADGAPADWLSAAQRSRLRARLRRGEPLEELAVACRRRAEVTLLRAPAAAAPRALAWPGAVPTGISASGHDLFAVGVAEIYLPDREVERVQQKLVATRVGIFDGATLIVRSSSACPFDLAERGVPRLAVCLDLFDAGDDRSRRTSGRIYREVLAARSWEL